MDHASTPQPQLHQQDPDALVRLGGWLFRRRTWLPLPLALAILLVPAPATPSSTVWWGLSIVGAGELLRLWAVRHIGVVSRTRIDRSGPLIDSGPFAFVRNPLYLGNMALWIGFAVSAGSFRLLPAVVLLLGLEYHAIVRWEETLLESRLGASYRAYKARVSRWVPSIPRNAVSSADTTFSWRDTLFSERGTLAAIAVGCGLVWVKRALLPGWLWARGFS